MFDFTQKVTGTQYTTTVALLIVAFIFSPAVLVVSGRSGYASISLAFACSALCLVFAWLNWKRYSLLTVPSILAPISRAK